MWEDVRVTGTRLQHGQQGRWAGWLLAAVAVLWLAVDGTEGWVARHVGSGRGASARRSAVGERRKVPALAFDAMEGGQWRLADQRGKVVVINFWATWCGPCVEEIPGMEALARRDGPRGLVIVGVAMDDGGRDGAGDKVRRFAERMRMNYPIVFVPAMSQMAMGMEGLPTTILVDREGRAVRTYVGAVEERSFGRDVEALLGESGGPGDAVAGLNRQAAPRVSKD